ncbi:MAG TPA: hypothetical protein VLC53_00985, partial [Myxococcota bacterium]|nr:hypothetical protein [Myxococcota bacterium]
MVEAWAAAGRVAAVALAEPNRLKKPPNDGFGFTAWAFAIWPLLGAYFDESLLARERRQVQLQPARAPG